jgi:type IV pilus assembly protein PilW
MVKIMTGFLPEEAMKRRRRRGRRAAPPVLPPSRGFSLVEIMVALVIGMIGVLVIMQVARTAEAQRRVTTGSGDSQSNGTLAIHSVQRDIRLAGYGFNSLNAVGCKLSIPARGSLSAVTLDVLAPVTINPPEDIVPAGDGGTDTLLIVHGDSEAPPEGDTIVSLEDIGTKRRVGVTSAVNFRDGDWVFVAPPSPEADCALILRQAEVHAPTIDVAADIGAALGHSLFDLGSPPRIVAYAVRDGDLTMCDYIRAECDNVSNWTVVANGIVGLRVHYGHDTGAPGDIDAWNQVSPQWAALPAGPDKQERFACAWARISAVRLALVARGGERQRENVTASVPRWTGSGSATTPDAPFDLSLTVGPDWQHFRYQVYETVMPLRNVPWMGDCIS